MGYKKICEPELLLQVLEQVDNLGLDRDIKGGNRFITDNKSGPQGKGTGYGNPLSLTPGKFMGISVGIGRLQSYNFQELLHPPPSIRRLFKNIVHYQGLTDNIANGHPRVQRPKGILENNLHLPPELAQFSRRDSENILTRKKHLACRYGKKANQNPPQGGFPAPAFPQQSKGSLGGYGQADTIDGLHPPGGRTKKTGTMGEVFFYVLKFDQLVHP
jgi:hypothetical protein